MPDSAALKINRATEHIEELNELFREKRPFGYVLETNTKTSERATLTKKNEAVVNTGALLCGDAVHNLRSALDHAYWEIVSPRLDTDRELKSAQFPFSKTRDGLPKAIQQRFAHYAGMGFYCALLKLRPYGEPGGNELLYLVHSLDTIDKHKLLIPTADYTRVSSDAIIKFAPDFPQNVQIGDSVVFGPGGRHIVWHFAGRLPTEQLGSIKPPTMHIFERELDVPVDIVFDIGTPGHGRPIIRTLDKMVDTTRETIEIMRTASTSC